MADSQARQVEEATNALQAQERLSWLLGQQGNVSVDVKDKVHSCLDSLRSQKASIEGSDLDMEIPGISEENLIELKQLTLMHTPSSVTKEARQKYQSLVEQSIGDQCKSIVSITLLTCPWYEISQRERGEQAKHNILLVIFTFKDDQFFSPTNPQSKEKAGVIDLGWFCAVELSHFGQALARGRSRYIEAVYCRQGAEIYGSPFWSQLRKSLSYETATGTKGFMEACLGQAVGGVGKKKKNGDMKMREGATIFELCESFRLLQHADNTLRLHANHTEITEEYLPPVAITASAQMKSFYDHNQPMRCKQELFDLLMTWTRELRTLAASVRPASSKLCQTESEKVIGDWLCKTRLEGRELCPCPVQDDHSKLVILLQKVGGPVSKMKPEQILLVAIAGSAMYNLNTSSSDVDYLVVYATPTQDILSATKKLPETYESRGLDKTIEYGAYEARTFCEMLLKCSVVILELLFADQHEYMSPIWQELASNRKSFVTEKAILQYLGLIKNNFRTIDRGRLSDAPKRDRKLFYQNFHKIHSLHAMIEGNVPEVKVTGDVRNFIMNVRTQDQGEWSRENVLDLLTKQYKEMREKLCNRTKRMRENPDYTLCTKWLMSVRGL